MKDVQRQPRHHSLMERHRTLGVVRDFLINFFAGLTVLFLSAAGITHIGFLQDKALDFFDGLRPEFRQCRTLPAVDLQKWGLGPAHPASWREYRVYRAALDQELVDLWETLQTARQDRGLDSGLIGAMPDLYDFIDERVPAAGGVARIQADRAFWRRIYGVIVTHGAERFGASATPGEPDGKLTLPQPLLGCIYVEFDLLSRRVAR